MTLTINKKNSLPQVKIASTSFQQARGLMFTKAKNFNFCLVFPLQHRNRVLNSVHMLFVFYKILAVFLDANKKVVDFKVLKPFTFYIPKRNCAYLLELPKEFEKKIKIGDEINW